MQKKPPTPEPSPSAPWWRHPNFGIWLSLAAVAGVATGLFIVYAHNFRPLAPPQDARASWGQLGDFIGGILNPVVAGAALFWLTRSVKMQKEELAETRAELARAAAAQRDGALLSALGTLLAIKEADFQTLHRELKALDTTIENDIQAKNLHVVRKLRPENHERWPWRTELHGMTDKALDARKELEADIRKVRKRLDPGDKEKPSAKSRPVEPAAASAKEAVPPRAV